MYHNRADWEATWERWNLGDELELERLEERCDDWDEHNTRTLSLGFSISPVAQNVFKNMSM